MKSSSLHSLVIPAKAGIQLLTGSRVAKLDSRLRGNDGVGGHIYLPTRVGL
jgi:hypothetical protein